MLYFSKDCGMNEFCVSPFDHNAMNKNFLIAILNTLDRVKRNEVASRFVLAALMFANKCCDLEDFSRLRARS